MAKLNTKNLFLICAAIMIVIRRLFFLRELLPAPFNYVGIVLIVVGLIMAFGVVRQFDKLGTEIHTFKTPRKLVTSGLFRFSRNPCYLGFVLSLLGIWILLGTLLPGIGLVFFVLKTNYWYIPYEERKMKKIFGHEYEVYKSKVRRWI